MFLRNKIYLNFFPLKKPLFFSGLERKKIKILKNFLPIFLSRKNICKNAKFCMRFNRSPLKNQKKRTLYWQIVESFLSKKKTNAICGRIFLKTYGKTSFSIGKTAKPSSFCCCNICKRFCLKKGKLFLTPFFYFGSINWKNFQKLLLSRRKNKISIKNTLKNMQFFQILYRKTICGSSMFSNFSKTKSFLNKKKDMQVLSILNKSKFLILRLTPCFSQTSISFEKSKKPLQKIWRNMKKFSSFQLIKIFKTLRIILKFRRTLKSRTRKRLSKNTAKKKRIFKKVHRNRKRSDGCQEQMLVKDHISSSRRKKKTGIKVTICQQHSQSCCKHWQTSNKLNTYKAQRPDKKRNAIKSHSLRTHICNSDQEINRSQNTSNSRNMQTKNSQVNRSTGVAQRTTQGRIRCPSNTRPLFYLGTQKQKRLRSPRSPIAHANFPPPVPSNCAPPRFSHRTTPDHPHPREAESAPA